MAPNIQKLSGENIMENGINSNEDKRKNVSFLDRKSRYSLKHVLHCILMVSFMILIIPVFIQENPPVESPLWNILGSGVVYFLYFIRILGVFIALPYEVFIFLGLFFYDTFPGPVQLKNRNLSSYPFICFRVATKGVSKKLIRNTVARNLKMIKEGGVCNYKLQVLTNNFVENLPSDANVEQMVVPSEYETRTGALYKAKNLQYAIETDTLGDKDWVVHLDEETLLTPNALRGILNFIDDGKHQFGQGLVTYSNDGDIVNWMTTVADTNRVADDLGKIRSQFRIFHRPLFSMKGPYTVAQMGAEKKVGFDHGPDGSIAEDCYHVMKAYDMGFTFDFIEGEMWEFSPFTLWDFVLQRKRWFQGILLVVYCGGMSLKSKFWLIIDFHCRFLQLFIPIFALMDLYDLLPFPDWFQLFSLPLYGLRLYMYVFGILKTADCGLTTQEKRPLKLVGLSLYALFIVHPIHVVMDILAVILGLWQPKHGFYLVKKEI